MIRIAPLFAIVLLAAAALPAVAGEADDAKAFVNNLYLRYANGEEMSDALWQAQIYDTAMLALMKEDERLTPEGEVGVLDWDPVCQCQDFAKIRAAVVVKLEAPGRAMATVDFNDIGMTDQSMRHAVFELWKEPQGWRIHDVHSSDFDNPKHSMRARFIEANQERGGAYQQ
jgi:hypothetical protein